MKRSEIAKKVKDLPGIPGAWPQWIFKAINEEFDSEFEKYNEEFGKIGDRIDSLHKQYDEVNNTRSKKLQKVVDKINLEDTSKLPLEP